MTSRFWIAAAAALALSACAGSPTPEPASAAESVAESATDQATVPDGFSWVFEGLGGMPRPGAGEDPQPDLKRVAAQGATRYVSFTETAIDPELVKAAGMQPEHMPIVDFTPPTQDQIKKFVAMVEAEINSGGKLVAHDAAGKGRLGTMLAAWFIYKGETSEQAITKIRELRPGSIETVPQEESLHEYARSIHGPTQ